MPYNQMREKEQLCPVLTMVMLAVQAAGRILVIPAVLLFCARMLLLDAPDLSLAAHTFAFAMLVVVTCWEVWCLACKHMELATVRDPFKEQREQLMLSYDLLIIRVHDLSAREAYSTFARLTQLHAHMLTDQLRWFEEMCMTQQLPPLNRQVGLMDAQAHLLRTHNHAAQVLESCHDLSVLAQSPDLNGMGDLTVAASSDVKNAYYSLLHFVHTILRLYPDVQSQVSSLYGFEEGSGISGSSREMKSNGKAV